MATPIATGSIVDEGGLSAVSWGAILAGGVAAAAVTLVLLAFGMGVGFSVVSPWTDQGVSSTTFAVGAGVYLIVVAMLSSTVGGYLAGRLRVRWAGVHHDEVYFRDTAHGLLSWAIATVLSATVLGGAITHILAGASAGAAPAAAMAANNAGPSDIYVDRLLRPDGSAATGATAAPQTNGGGAAATRAELTRLLVPGLKKGADVSAADRTYAARVVSVRTGLSQADAEKRVNDTIAEAKKAADDARKATAKLSLWLAASMLAGALASILAATEGGLLRDSPWYEAGWRPGQFGTERSPR
jgi:hypothetical protein